MYINKIDLSNKKVYLDRKKVKIELKENNSKDEFIKLCELAYKMKKLTECKVTIRI